jgi:secreted trypsin-like serine protease
MILSLSIHSLANTNLFPLINGGEKVEANDPIAKSTVMLETDAQYCSATIIANNLLLTAAHCIGQNESWVTIHFSGLEGNQSRNASRFFRHEYYQDLQETTRNDVALVFFDGGLPDGFNPVKILPSDYELKFGDELQVAGYGMGGPQGVLAKISLQVSDFLNAKNLIKFEQTKTRGICHGDSGGPAYRIINNQMYLAGVASYTQEIDCSGFAVYTSATEFIEWIQKKQKDK